MASGSHIPIGEAQQRIEEFPTTPLPPPRHGDPVFVDPDIINGFFEPGTKLVQAVSYAHSIGSSIAKLEVQLVNGTKAYYFLKTITGTMAKSKCESEYEALKAIHEVSPRFAPKPCGWGQLKTAERETFFLLEEFVGLKEQIGVLALSRSLAELHHHSQSPTGKFGFELRTWHGDVDQNVDQWDDSWAALFHRHLSHIVDIATPRMNSPEFDVVSRLTLEKVIPRLLIPLQEHGRVLKPSLLHGDCWDGNTALNGETGEACVFDACSFYGHNEYDTGNWRAPRHRLSDPAYVECYKQHFQPSEPVGDWSARQLLYSLCFNLGNLISIPGSREGEVVYEDMTTLCKMFCPHDLDKQLAKLGQR